MEEVRNSDNLKKEILEDARKKAERIMRNAEKQAALLRDEGEKKTSSEIADLAREYARRTAFLEKETLASLPLEKRRIKQHFLAEKFEECLAAFVSGISDEEAASVLKKRLSGTAHLLGNEKYNVTYSGLKAETVRKILEGHLAQGQILSLSETKRTKGLVIASANGRITYRLTFDEITEELREFHRKEIFDALFKGTANHD